MKNLTFLFLVFLTLLFTSCETVVDLELEQSKPVLAVEGIVTDQVNRSYVKLNLTAPYVRNEEPSPVKDAQVRLTDNTGANFVLVHEANGIYKPAADFKGVIGRSYTLTVEANGQTYTAFSVLNQVPALDKVNFEYVDGKNDDYGRKEGYYIKTSWQDIAGQRNYTKIEVVVNGQIKERDPGDVMITEDKLYDGSYLSDIDIYIAFAKKDRLDVRLLSLTKEAYDFYSALNQLSQQGGFMGRNPANLPTNISNGAVGFFSASAVSAKSLVIE